MLVGVRCALVDPSSGIEFDQSTVSFAGDKVYYNVIFTVLVIVHFDFQYKDVDGSEETVSKVLNSIQLNVCNGTEYQSQSMIGILQSAINQCDAMVTNFEKPDNLSVCSHEYIREITAVNVLFPFLSLIKPQPCFHEF